MLFRSGGPLTIENVEPTPPGPRDVVVQLGASGVCHSDLSLKNGYVGIMPGTILGHEGAGTVLEVGAEVTSVKPGDRKLAITLFTMLFMFGSTLTIIGSFFRGTGYNWVWPWAQGVFFEL